MPYFFMTSPPIPLQLDRKVRKVNNQWQDSKGTITRKMRAIAGSMSEFMMYTDNIFNKKSDSYEPL